MLSNVLEIDQGTYSEVLDFNIQTGTNLIVLGLAGTGKTEMGLQACDRTGFQSCYLDLSVLEAPDLVGLQYITQDEGESVKYVEYASPKFLPRKKPGSKPKVLIVDEIDKAKPELQNPLLELFQLHSINGHPLDIQAIIATGNLPEEGAFSRPISHALTNRCKVFKLTHSFEVWRDWAQNEGINPLVIGFLSRNQEFLCKPPVEGDPTAYTRPSPRSWTNSARDLNFTDSKKHSVDFQSMLVAGHVGTEAAIKFRIWLDHSRHVEPVVDELWKTGRAPSMNDMTVDKQLITAISAVDLVTQACKRPTKTPQERQKLMEEVQKGASNVFGWIQQIPSEFQIGAVKSTLNMKLIGDFQLTKIPPVMKTYMNVKRAMREN